MASIDNLHLISFPEGLGEGSDLLPTLRQFGCMIENCRRQTFLFTSHQMAALRREKPDIVEFIDPQKALFNLQEPIDTETFHFPVLHIEGKDSYSCVVAVLCGLRERPHWGNPQLLKKVQDWFTQNSDPKHRESLKDIMSQAVKDANRVISKHLTKADGSRHQRLGAGSVVANLIQEAGIEGDVLVIYDRNKPTQSTPMGPVDNFMRVAEKALSEKKVHCIGTTNQSDPVQLGRNPKHKMVDSKFIDLSAYEAIVFYTALPATPDQMEEPFKRFFTDPNHSKTKKFLVIDPKNPKAWSGLENTITLKTIGQLRDKIDSAQITEAVGEALNACRECAETVDKRLHRSTSIACYQLTSEALPVLQQNGFSDGFKGWRAFAREHPVRAENFFTKHGLERFLKM